METTDIDKLLGRFLKYGTEISSRPSGKIHNLSICNGILLNACKVENIFSKQAKESNPLITGLSRYCH